MALASAAVVMAVALPLAAMQAERKIYKTGGDVSTPKLLHKEEPSYTADAKDAKIEGGVLLSGVIEADGRLSEIEVLRGLDPGLDANAVEAVQKWLFRPAEKNGTAVPVSVRIEVNFRLL
jgi:protein TonB